MIIEVCLFPNSDRISLGNLDKYNLSKPPGVGGGVRGMVKGKVHLWVGGGGGGL